MGGEPQHDEIERRLSVRELSRRIGDVERAQQEQGLRMHELAGEVTVIGLKVEHSHEMIRQRFTGLESSIAALTARIDVAIQQQETSRESANSTPAGRELLADIRDLHEWQTDHEPTIDSMRSFLTVGRVVVGGSIVASASSIIAILVALGVIHP